MDKKKIIAIILFILLGLFIFTFANPAPSTLDPVEVPGQGEEDKDTDNEQDDNKDEEQDDEQEEDNNDRPVINVDEAPVIEINPKTVTILFGQNYDVMTGVKASDDNDVVSVTASITDTTKLEVGTHTITYTTSDKAGHTTTATRTIIVLNPTGDNDNDGYTNEEEIENGTNPDDEEEYPEYSKNPSIDFSSCATSMVVYDELINFEDCVKATDEFYGTEGVTIEVTNDVNPNQFGKYTITVVAKDNLNNETTENFEFEVLKRNVTVTINNVEAIYKDEVKPLTSNALEMAYNGNEIGVQLNTEVTNTTPAGKYAITGTWTNENYNVTFVDGVYSITSKTITEEDIKELGIEFNGATFIYDGTEKSLSVNNLPEEFNISYENNGKVDAGEYEVKAIITGNENYNGEITLTATMTISPKEIRLTWIDRGPFIYNGEKQVFKPQPVEGVEITVDVEGGNGIDVGKYTAVASTTNKNYTLTNNRQEYEIIAKTITEEDIKELGIEFNDETFVYDGTEKSLSVNNLPEGFNVSYENNDKVDVGEYEVKAIITGNENYNGEITLTATMTISPKEIRLTWIDRGPFIYNGEKQVFKPQPVEGVEITVDVEGGNGIDVGKYTAVASTTNKNYTLTNNRQEYEIIAKTITEEDIKELGIEFNDETFVYDGTEKSLSVNNLPEGFNVSYENNDKVDVGEYEVKAIITGNENYNGEITLTATMTISPKEVRVYWIDRGTFIYNGEKQLPTAGAENGIEITVDVEEGNAIDVGKYTALASTTNKNYTLTNTTFEYEIVAKEIKVTWIDRGDYTYDGKMHIPTAIVENGIDYTVKVKDGNAIDAGNYTAIVVTSDGNYVLVGATKDYKILKATPSYTIPSNLEANEGETLGDVELPEGFTFEESTTKVLTEGEYKTTVIYTPEDTKNYNVVEGIEVTIKVKPVYFIIKFLDKDNQIISTQEIKKGESAKEPNITKEYEANGKIYIFNGWAGNYKNVTADATIKPIYLEQEASGTYAYILKPQYVRPVDGEGYPTDYYYNALEDEEGNKVSLTINVSGLTEEQANDIKNGVDPVIIGLGEEEVFKYLAQSTKDALNEISHGVDEGGAYTIEWYVLKYQADGWHLDGHKVYDKTIVNVGKKGLNISVNFNNAVTNLKVEADGKKIDMYNPTLNNKIGNTWISVLPIFSDTVKVTYTVNGIEYTETFDI